MPIRYSHEYHDETLAQGLVKKIKAESKKPFRLMEVCGTHTMAIFRHGIRSLLPKHIELISGPGCPVCVTAQNEIDAFIRLAQKEDVIITTFGDLMRVPGTDSSLLREKARGFDIQVVYTPFDVLEISQNNPSKQVVFLGIGFETTAPAIAATILTARQRRIVNLKVYPALKTVRPALRALMAAPDVRIDGFMLPGHVSVILGTEAYRDFFDTYQISCVIAGFEPVDILSAIVMTVEQAETGAVSLENAYRRAVTDAGNVTAQKTIETVFETADTRWRGIGIIPESGLTIREAFSDFDARQLVSIPAERPEPKGCSCGDILVGRMQPPECKLYKKACTPEDPVGPCMVSCEGVCAAFYRYHSE